MLHEFGAAKFVLHKFSAYIIKVLMSLRIQKIVIILTFFSVQIFLVAQCHIRDGWQRREGNECRNSVERYF